MARAIGRGAWRSRGAATSVDFNALRQDGAMRYIDISSNAISDAMPIGIEGLIDVVNSAMQRGQRA
jgi:hypothetical protein